MVSSFSKSGGLDNHGFAKPGPPAIFIAATVNSEDSLSWRDCEETVSGGLWVYHEKCHDNLSESTMEGPFRAKSDRLLQHAVGMSPKN